ncbi:hypothetical protein SD77_3165 [Bacillus badius]|uniref:Uncharacterized protein n=1 Tax=Bacillus badius TaxID=1455 RepID=A0ABR5AXA3_BACBA|nr:hypothetical protein SD77_3165 [Bacillus badius]
MEYQIETPFFSPLSPFCYLASNFYANNKLLLLSALGVPGFPYCPET